MHAKHSHSSMAIQPIISSLHSHFHLQLLPHSPTVSPFTFLPGHLHSKFHKAPRKSPRILCKSNEDDYLIDSSVSVGDGFSFSGGKYSDGSSPSDEWFKQGKMMKAHPVSGFGEKAKDPVFGLTMGLLLRPQLMFSDGSASKVEVQIIIQFC
ncbi:uncharacterized protein LOC116104871 isoform X1 [Pistacia vera]|uniref:uncharacterized protein LOC116104871 isoform X1 n=1 Tax=Pistacia vera TaxID=55513 RepID=UPI001262F187|nr:uncharacterized protein LOC116104871 isoform X1 [Pistacia vera]XP_031247162.1 uncharacterized protein LOC116104871 isoform X1 [Pistacia vera]XP_031247164.1 uncharacterized protein LOC116104871 isoform X1 [Pistacia vera]XP_031247165.1 uncharacterized protein LOC116104871 isoform X1 [Pistacia vera]